MLPQKSSVANTSTGVSNSKHPINCDHQQQQHQQQQPLVHTPNLGWARRGSHNNLVSAQIQAQQQFNALTNERRKTSINYQQQQQQHHALLTNSDLVTGIEPSVTAEYFLPQAKLTSSSLCSSTTAPTSVVERYEDTLACCLPPPSPAPNSDRFIDDTGLIIATNNITNHQQHHHLHQQHQQHQQQQQQLPLSASTNSLGAVSNCSSTTNNLNNNSNMLIVNHQQQHSKYLNSSGQQLFNNPIELTNTLRHRLTVGNYRDVGSTGNQNGSTRFIPHATHYLDIASNNVSLTSSDTYTYLTSTVHTPVKRYVPTPPPPQEFYTNETMQQQQQQQQQHMTAASSIMTKCNNVSGGQQHSFNTVPYRMQRLKCCSNEATGITTAASTGVGDYNIHSIAPSPSNHLLPREDLYNSSTSRLRNYSNTSSNNLKLNCNSESSGGGHTTPFTQLLMANGRESPLMIFQDPHQQQPQAPLNISNLNSGASYGSLASLPSNCSTAAVNSTQIPSRHMVSTATRINNNTPPACFLNENNDYPVSTTRSDDEINGVGNGVNISATGSSSTLATTCLHCKTVRRTTGVHQTTQTTGPISPVPVLSPIPLPNPNNNTARLQMLPNSNASIMEQQQVTAAKSDKIKTVVDASSSTSPNNSTNPIFDCGVIKTLDICNENPSLQTVLLQQQQSTYNSPLQPLGDNPDSGAISLETADLSSHILRNKTNLALQSQSASAVSTSQQHSIPRYTTKQRLLHYMHREMSRFFGVDSTTELEDYNLWQQRQRRLALRRFGVLKADNDLADLHDPTVNYHQTDGLGGGTTSYQSSHSHQGFYQERPDILPANDTVEDNGNLSNQHRQTYNFNAFDFRSVGGVGAMYAERKASVVSMLMSGIHYLMQTINNHQKRYSNKQWSRSFVPAHIQHHLQESNRSEVYEEVVALQGQEIFFDTPLGGEPQVTGGAGDANSGSATDTANHNDRHLYLSDRGHGWRTSNLISSPVTQPGDTPAEQQSLNTAAMHCQPTQQQQQQQQQSSQISSCNTAGIKRGGRISSQLLDSVLENSRRPLAPSVKLVSVNDLDDRSDHRPFFTYWINTVQILVVMLSLLCYGLAPLGLGVEQRSGQVLVTSLSLQTVSHQEPRNVWIGPRNNDLVHIGAKLATCMRRDLKIMEVVIKTRRQERETACCIRNDDSGCVQSSQADCSVRGLFPTKSISTWKKWSPGESGPGGRISGSVCGLDPKYCDAPASIAPYEWPDDITKWPICRKTNSFSQRFRFKDHTSEHMVCEVIGHPCCSGVYGECRITTREYCDFINGYFHEEASLCSQVSCLSNVCGMFPFLNVEMPDQFYRLFTSLCIHAGIMHLAITVIFQHVFLADLERLMGSLRTAILYIGSGFAGNLTSAILMPYKAEVGPLASLSGVLAALVVLLTLIHWQQLHKPHMALFKLLVMAALLFGLGTLPWQLNFAGLLAGIFCGIFLTIALVPFVSIHKYRRKSKINLIWSCLIFHLFIYATMLLIFYMFPTELTKLNFGEVFVNSLDNGVGTSTGTGDGIGDNGIGTHIGSTNSDILRGTGSIGANNNNNQNNKNRHTFMQQQQQYHYHHHSDDIISNSVSAAAAILLT